MMISGESLSSILGWISIACWIIVYSPQVYENYTLQSGEGLSVLFVIIWLLGDFTNLTGALLAGLLPTVVLLAIYYTTCDSILLFQIYYYRWKRNRIVTGISGDSDSPHPASTPLLGDESRPNEEASSTKKPVLRYASTLIFVVGVGVAAWWFTKEEDTNLVDVPKEGKRWIVIQILGWSSALLFLGARVPQILKNFKTRCEGLSPALFFFAIFGNTTYALSICAKSIDRDYLIKNGGWLAGSMLTVFLDIFVLCQFWYYRYTDEIRSQTRVRID